MSELTQSQVIEAAVDADKDGEASYSTNGSMFVLKFILPAVKELMHSCMNTPIIAKKIKKYKSGQQISQIFKFSYYDTTKGDHRPLP